MMASVEGSNATVARKIACLVSQCEYHTTCDQKNDSQIYYSPDYLTPQVRYLVDLLLRGGGNPGHERGVEWDRTRLALSLQLPMLTGEHGDDTFMGYVDEYQQARARVTTATGSEKDKAQMFDAIFKMMGILSNR